MAISASMIRVAVGLAALLVTASGGFADNLTASASVRSNNSLIVEIQVTAGGRAAKAFVTYRAVGVDPLVSRLTPVSTTGPTTITIGRLRANTAYTYTVDAIDDQGAPAGTAVGTFTTGSLPLPLSMNWAWAAAQPTRDDENVVEGGVCADRVGVYWVNPEDEPDSGCCGGPEIEP